MQFVSYYLKRWSIAGNWVLSVRYRQKMMVKNGASHEVDGKRALGSTMWTRDDCLQWLSIGDGVIYLYPDLPLYYVK